MDTGEYEDDFEPPEPILPPIPKYSSMTYNLDFYDEEGSSKSGNQDRITGFLNDMLDQSISDLIKEDEVLGKFEDPEFPASNYKKCAREESGVRIGAKDKVTSKDLALLSLREKEIQKKDEPALDDMKSHISKRKASKKKRELPKDVNAVNIKPGTKFNPVQLKPALMEDSENLRMDVLVKEYRRIQVMEYINHIGVTREEPDTSSQDVNHPTIPNPSSLFGKDSNDCTETIHTGKLDLPGTRDYEGKGRKMDERQTEKEMGETKIEKKMDETLAKKKMDETKAEKKMDETQAEKKMDETKPEKKMDETQAEKKMDEIQAEKKMGETRAEMKMDETQAEKKMDETKAEKKMDETQVEKKMDETRAEMKMDETKAEKKMDETQAEKKMDETNTEKKIYEKQAEEDVDETQAEKEVDETKAGKKLEETHTEKKIDETQAEKEMVETTGITPSAQKPRADFSVCLVPPVNAEELKLPQANSNEIADEERTVRVSRTILDVLLRRKKVIKTPQTKNQKPKLNILNCFKTQENNEDETISSTDETPHLKRKRGFISRCLTLFRRSGRVQPSNIG